MNGMAKEFYFCSVLVCMYYILAIFQDHLSSNVDVECVPEETKSSKCTMLPI